MLYCHRSHSKWKADLSSAYIHIHPHTHTHIHTHTHTHTHAGANVYARDDVCILLLIRMYPPPHMYVGANVYARDDAGMTADQAAALGDRYAECVLYRMCSL